MNLKKELERDGFLVYPFPKLLSDAMKAHILQFFNVPPDKLTEKSQSFTDEEFTQKFAKPFRMFPDSVAALAVDWVKGLSFGAPKAGINYICPDERKKNPALREDSYDIFWRCVRPGKPDVGSAHCDFQFWEIAKGTSAEVETPFKYFERWKIWVPLFGCSSENSLQVVPASHRQDVPTDRIMTKNGLKPVIQPHWLEKHEKDFICPLADFGSHCVLFHDKLVHRGPPNHTQSLRLSGEFTILLGDA